MYCTRCGIETRGKGGLCVDCRSVERLIDKTKPSESEAIKELEYRLPYLSGRTRDIVTLRVSGDTYSEIAERYGITRQRAHQVCRRESDIARISLMRLGSAPEKNTDCCG